MTHIERDSERTPDLATHYIGDHLRMVSRDGWEFAQRNKASGAVMIFALTTDDKVVLIEQFRPPLNRKVIELPAGLIGDHGDGREGAEIAGMRELEEETGFRASKVTALYQRPSSAGLTDEMLTFVYAEGLTQVNEGGGVEGEKITVHVVPLTEVDNWLNRKEAEGLLISSRIENALRFFERIRKLQPPSFGEHVGI